MDAFAFDAGLLRLLNLHRFGPLDPLLVAITETTGFIAFGIPLIALIAARIRRRPHRARAASVVLVAVALSAVISNILKVAVDRARPFEVLPDVLKLAGGGSGSFPSGHTSDAFALATALALVFPGRRLVWPALAWAVAVGYTRIALGVHYPSDVLGGALIGFGSAWLVQAVAARRLRPGPQDAQS